MIETERLSLRPWREGDGREFVRVTNTPAVMRYLSGVSAPSDGRGLVANQRALQARHGYCSWLMTRRADAAILGLCGLEPASIAGFANDVEIGWRLREDAWGHGYAREAAIACLDWAWTNLAVPRVVAFTVPANEASRGLMRRIGMTRRPELDFDHPAFAPGHPLRRHVTCAIDRP